VTQQRSIRVPGDKSLTHRALMFAALATGRSVIRRPLAGADTNSTAAALRALGCTVPLLDSAAAIMIDGVGLRGMRSPRDVVDCGNSGTTTRLLLGMLAGQPIEAVLTGDGSLRSRPMRRVTGPLSSMGARFDELAHSDRLPIRIRGGALHGIDYESPHASAQVKSAVLLAGLTGGVQVSVSEPMLSRDHTENMLERAGVPLRRSVAADGTAHVASDVVDHIDPLDFDVPGDFSSAAFVIALACLTADEPLRIIDVGLNETRTGFLDLLARMGAHITVENQRNTGGERIGDLIVERAQLHATELLPAEVPRLIDEIPVYAVLAARAEGTTVIDGAGELRVKESDRIAAVVANLRAIGVNAEEMPHGLVVHGTNRPLAGHVRSLHDHRIAMAFGVLSAAGNADITIDDTTVVDVSFPGFWSMLDEFGSR
jgi:3-phosphoshikimate 1-carboxyvinyltransferase